MGKEDTPPKKPAFPPHPNQKQPKKSEKPFLKAAKGLVRFLG